MSTMSEKYIGYQELMAYLGSSSSSAVNFDQVVVSDEPPFFVEGEWYLKPVPLPSPMVLKVTIGDHLDPNSNLFIMADGIDAEFIIDWGDGTTTTKEDMLGMGDFPNRKKYNKLYTSNAVFTVTISGKSKDLLLPWHYLSEIVSFGTYNNSRICFEGSTLLMKIPKYLPPTVLACDSMFSGCYVLNDNIGDWDVRNVTAFDYMFQGCTSYNQDLSYWDVSTVYPKPHGFTAYGNSNWVVEDQPQWPSGAA